MTALVGVNMNFGNGKNTFMPVIIEQQKQLAASLPQGADVETDGLSHANGAHFDTKGTLEMGPDSPGPCSKPKAGGNKARKSPGPISPGRGRMEGPSCEDGVFPREQN